ncbi:efflux RND transporter periplasmic adaptor subunit [Pseudoduganella plicata]|uniref:Efflux RND transporter periplasmic adaptor subunit n=1 Tax=Pseudoduganella plicata TaxID=321984 RepID=A0A4P7BMV5_9BURK|nr:efflux RND transporter periplasmic adaptor subunit [Pseudoduganella plicata]QBQ39095.1 efflux RND transporter periplasmic adaptor subunit [Pseudoduganella plicata]GGY87262.1 MexE family multidrug efflux RND transporter periplasmic adaptor subunit [Pseudoduganella plicata]
MTKPSYRQQAVFLSALLSMTLGAALSGCDKAASKEGTGSAPAAAPVSAAVVVQRDIVETREFSGRLEAVERVEIRPRVSGYITAVHFTPGSLVKKGQPLFSIDPRPYQAELAKAEADANSASARAALAKVELERAERLLADRAIARREFDERSSAVKDLDAAARATRATVDAARLNVNYTSITAPIAGRVSKAEITLGNLVDGNAVLTSVVSTDRIYASFDGDEDSYLRVRQQKHTGKDVAVRVGLANEEGFPHEGKLEFVDNRLDPATGSVRMRATLDNRDGMLVPGLFARVQLAAGGTKQAAVPTLLIHDRAVGTDQDRKFVFVLGRDNKAEYRPVALGPAVDGLRVVRSGLKPGEKIVVSGLQRVTPGAALAPSVVAMDADPDAVKGTPAQHG